MAKQALHTDYNSISPTALFLSVGLKELYQISKALVNKTMINPLLIIPTYVNIQHCNKQSLLTT